MSNAKQLPLRSLLQILLESLRQKYDMLCEIELKSKEQSDLILNPDVSLEAIDQNMSEKGELIEKLTRLDRGFEALYDNVRKELVLHKDEHKELIAQIQQSVAFVMEKSASIEAIEARNKAAMEIIFRNRRKELQHKKAASIVARQYYKAAKKLDHVTPQFLDKKK